MFLSCSSCLILEGRINAVFLNISIWHLAVSLFLYFLYFSCFSSVLFFKNCLYSRGFFYKHFFNEFFIHGLLFFTVSCVQLLTGQFELYKFVNKLINLLYVMLTSSSLTMSSQLHFSKSFMKAFFQSLHI